MRKLIKVLSLLLICSMLSSCIFLLVSNVKRKAKKELTVENGAIPEYLGRYGATMLVEKVNSKRFDKNCQKIFKNYIGPYEFINLGDEAQEKYSNIEKYRYIFRTEVDYSDRRYDDGSTVIFYRHSIYDRITKTEYKADYAHSVYTKVLKGYIDNLNDEIKANN